MGAPYTREAAAYPSPEMEARKFWSPVARVTMHTATETSCAAAAAFGIEELLG